MSGAGGGDCTVSTSNEKLRSSSVGFDFGVVLRIFELKGLELALRGFERNAFLELLLKRDGVGDEGGDVGEAGGRGRSTALSNSNVKFVTRSAIEAEFADFCGGLVEATSAVVSFVFVRLNLSVLLYPKVALLSDRAPMTVFCCLFDDSMW